MQEAAEKIASEFTHLVILEAAKRAHARYGFKTDCQCGFCVTKRRATIAVGSLPYYSMMRRHVPWSETREQAIDLERRILREDWSRELDKAYERYL